VNNIRLAQGNKFQIFVIFQNENEEFYKVFFTLNLLLSSFASGTLFSRANYISCFKVYQKKGYVGTAIK
jgi:hypothetical protein